MLRVGSPRAQHSEYRVQTLDERQYEACWKERRKDEARIGGWLTHMVSPIWLLLGVQKAAVGNVRQMTGGWRAGSHLWFIKVLKPSFP